MVLILLIIKGKMNWDISSCNLSCFTTCNDGNDVTKNMFQHHRCCVFDSPGLASDSEVYPGSFAVRGNNAVGVVPFIPRYFITTFHAENVQHLRR